MGLLSTNRSAAKCSISIAETKPMLTPWTTMNGYSLNIQSICNYERARRTIEDLSPEKLTAITGLFGKAERSGQIAGSIREKVQKF